MWNQSPSAARGRDSLASDDLRTIMLLVHSYTHFTKHFVSLAVSLVQKILCKNILSCHITKKKSSKVTFRHGLNLLQRLLNLY